MAPTLGRSPSIAAAQEPRQGGTYRLLTNEQFRSLDPALAYNYVDYWISASGLFNRLYNFDRQGNLFAELADAPVQVSDDGLTYTVKLRSGITFHNGQEMTAEDVKFSFDRVVWPGTLSPGSTFLSNVVGYDELANLSVPPETPMDASQGLSGVRVVDPLTVSFTLKEPQAVFPAILTVILFGIVPKQAVLDAGRGWGTEVVIGTGPFELAEWVAGERIVLERNPDYFRAGLPHLDQIEVTLNVQDEVATLRWESGEADVITGAPAAELARIRADPNLSPLIREVPSMVIYYFEFASNAPPFDDLRVRQAVAMAIDKETLAARSQNGVPVDAFMVPGYPQTAPDFESAYPYDPDQARQLLREAGVEEGTETIFWSGGTSPQLGDLIQADLAAVGFDAELLVLEGSSIDAFKPRLDSGEIPLRTWGFGPDYADGSAFPTARLVCTPQSPESAWCDPEVADLIDQANALPLEAPERTELLRRVQQIVVTEQVYVVPLYARNAFVLGQEWVHGDVPDSLFLLPILEEVWVDER